MKIIVQKFGGTSVANIDCIKNVASKIKKEYDNNNKVAVIVSAMSGETDKLDKLAKEVSDLNTTEKLKEYDTIMSSGEQITSALLALTLQQEYSIKARSWLAWQLKLHTNKLHGKARIEKIDTKDILLSLKNNEVAIIAGFQGISPENRITTLGRGGSDTTAVAISHSLKASRCDIYTDVEGIYTADPNIVSNARKLQKIAYEEMLEMASLGAKVLQTRSVEMAMKLGVRVQVLSSFKDVAGSLLVNEEEIMERRLITGVTCSRSDVQITLRNIKNIPGIAAKVFAPLTKKEVNVDMIVQNTSLDSEETDITFTVANNNKDIAIEALKTLKDIVNHEDILVDPNVAKVSVVGIGMKTHSGLAQKMFSALADKGINILVITTSEIKISVLIHEEYAELALRVLHSEYNLDQK